jgi:ATP adenylyltransferase
MNLYPYNPGHLMVIPYEHTADFGGLPSEVASELVALGQRCTQVLATAMQPHGFNLGMNLGRVAGAGIAEHLHLHIVPRWNGDTNFMPLIGGVKLVPEALDDTYAALRPHFDALASSS